VVLVGALSRRLAFPAEVWQKALAASVPPKILAFESEGVFSSVRASMGGDTLTPGIASSVHTSFAPERSARPEPPALFLLPWTQYQTSGRLPTLFDLTVGGAAGMPTTQPHRKGVWAMEALETPVVPRGRPGCRRCRGRGRRPTEAEPPRRLEAQFDPSTAKYVMKVSAVSSAAIEAFAVGYKLRDTLWEKTNGQLYYDYYPLSQLGGEVEVLNQLTMGAVQGMLCSSVVAPKIGPRMGVINLPFLVNSFDKAGQAHQGPRLSSSTCSPGPWTTA